MARDLSLRHRKAFDLCYSVSCSLQESGATPDAPYVAVATETACGLARAEISVPAPGVALGAFLQESLSSVIDATKRSLDRLSGGDEQDVAGVASRDDEIDQAVEAGYLALAALGKRMPDEGGSARAPAGCGISSAFRNCVEGARLFYLAHLADEAFPLPAIELSIVHAKAANTSFPGVPTAFNAELRFDDRDSRKKSSELRLKVSSAAVAYGCPAILPYILMHELLCHWPQFAGLDRARSNPQEVASLFDHDASSFECDPFAEGWMDSLVSEVLGWRPEEGRAPYMAESEIETAKLIHGLRTQYITRPFFQDAVRIAGSAIASRCVRELYATDPSADRATGGRDFARLSCEMNVAPWNYRERARGCHLIAEACDAYRDAGQKLRLLEATSACIVEALLGFRQSRDIYPLMHALASR